MAEQLGDNLAALLALSFVLIAPYLQPPWVLTIMILLFSSTLYLITKTRYFAIALIPIALLYGLALLPLLVFCCTITIIVTGELAFRWGGGELPSYLAYILAAFTGCILVMLYLHQIIPLVILFGVVVAVLLKAILRNREDALMIEALGIAMTMYLIMELNYQADIVLIVAAVLIAFGFGYFSYRTRTADVSGLFSGALIGIILIVFADIRWFLIMLAFFILGSVSTRYRYREKEKMGVEQKHGGARGYLNVFSNGVIAAASAVLWGVTANPLFAALFVGSVATAAADTMASEIGVTGGEPYMITTFSRVPAGTNGGVTILGETVAAAGAFIISVIAFLLGVIPLPFVVVGTVAGFIGTNIDSLVGALIENKGVFGNAGTNLVATAGGGICGLLLAMLG
ncbi:MAG TPA: TIGR00297 family protein [Methanoregulaceae archaeon]|nr:TIGR00297 family protein [Methanoregulaceae archaeon]